jgi:hypothetical protein
VVEASGEACHPFCERNPVQAWPGPGSRDEVHYLSGWVYERRFKNWFEGEGYDLEIGRPGGGQSAVSWRITSISSEECALRITVRPGGLQKYPAVVRWVPFLLWRRPKLRSYLDSVVRGFEWHVTRDAPVFPGDGEGLRARTTRGSGRLRKMAASICRRQPGFSSLQRSHS